VATRSCRPAGNPRPVIELKDGNYDPAAAEPAAGSSRSGAEPVISRSESNR
jgi:hypothetical protein